MRLPTTEKYLPCTGNLEIMGRSKKQGLEKYQHFLAKNAQTNWILLSPEKLFLLKYRRRLTLKLLRTANKFKCSPNTLVHVCIHN